VRRPLKVGTRAQDTWHVSKAKTEGTSQPTNPSPVHKQHSTHYEQKDNPELSTRTTSRDGETGRRVERRLLILSLSSESIDLLPH
jgi:hypothetical protein